MLFCSTPLLRAQERVDVFGYFETSAMGSRIQHRMDQLFSNKLRVDVASDVADNITFAANFDYITYHGSTSWNLLDYLPDHLTAIIDRKHRPFYTLPFDNRQFLDNAFIRVAFERFDLTAGKQQISLGTGYVWNPVDVFNIKDPLDPTYEQPGHNALRLDIPIGLRYTATALYSPDESWTESAKLLQFKGRVSRFDYSVLAIETVWRFHDYTRLAANGLYFVEQPERRRLLGAGTAGELLGLGLWAEYGYNSLEQSDDFQELVIGLDYTFDSQTYLMTEYYRNTLGKSDKDLYTLNDWMRQLAGEQKAISRDQLYLLLQHPVTDFIDLGTSCLYSLSDQSVAIIPTLNYSFAANMQITAYVNINLGSDGSVYATDSGNGGLVRARIYF
jgi:hypothetical protein